MIISYLCLVVGEHRPRPDGDALSSLTPAVDYRWLGYWQIVKVSVQVVSAQKNKMFFCYFGQHLHAAEIDLCKVILISVYFTLCDYPNMAVCCWMLTILMYKFYITEHLKLI